MQGERRHSPARRRGLTLIELLVVLGIVSVVMGLVLPAVFSAHRSALRLHCGNNLRQLGLALHSYEAAWRAFPPESSTGIVPVRRLGRTISVQTLLLPYLDQSILYQNINFSLAGMTIDTIDPGNSTISRWRVATFLCPSDPSAEAGCNSYRANIGLCRSCDDPLAGAFTYGPGDLSQFRDGLSHTLAFSEKPISRPGGPYSPFTDWLNLGDPVQLHTDAQWVQLCSRQTDPTRAVNDAGRSWLLSGAIYTQFFMSTPPNSQVPDCGTRNIHGSGVFAARSYHPGGVQGAMADGSVRWFASTIELNAWRALGTRAGGGETISGP